MPRIHDFLILVCLAVVSVTLSPAPPSCRSAAGYAYKYYICEGLRSDDDFHQHVQRDDMLEETHFILKDSHLDHLPATVFRNANISALEFRNSRIQSFTYPGSATGPLNELRETLRKLIFSNQSSLPESWSVLQNLTELRTLQLVAIGQVNLTRDFNNLPTSIRQIQILGASIGRVDEDWISQLYDIELIKIAETTLKKVSRSMFPRPATKLLILDMPENQLTSLPKDFTQDMPALKVLSVAYNQISTFHEETLAPLDRDDSFVNMIGNVLNCECKLAFLLRYPGRWIYYVCGQPSSLSGKYIRSLIQPELCSTTNHTRSEK
ncbi:secreted protein, putative [Ixodes scapularis]|uniref:Secreted protein, putative n=1 Tax=Ixodes scapularis TaxID=6945 RepID=B7PLI8_IXOSC|nr:secreted protein, putative [Ixodes scapularis]|eukprot:XP_002434636.1 secreted protein, putative [Ixodes scapularis]